MQKLLMTFSVIIPTYDDWERLQQCLNSLTSQKLPPSEFEIIVVNNGENGDVPEWVNLPENAIMVHEARPGSYAARNRGASAAEGLYLAFTDSDCLPEPDWLWNAKKQLQKTGMPMLGGQIEIYRPEGGSRIAYLYDNQTAFPQHLNVPKGHSVTANFFVRRDLFEKEGGFRVDMKSGGDWEFTGRCTQKGYAMVYGKEVVVSHPSSKKLGDIFKKQRRLTCWGSINAQEKYRYSAARVMLSFIVNGWRNRQKETTKFGEQVVLWSIDTALYIYKIYIHTTIVLRLTDPKKIRS